MTLFIFKVMPIEQLTDIYLQKPIFYNDIWVPDYRKMFLNTFSSIPQPIFGLLSWPAPNVLTINHEDIFQKNLSLSPLSDATIK